MSQKHYLENFKITDYKYQFWILKITAFLADIGYLVKLLSNYPSKHLLVLKTSWKKKNCYAEDVLKTCLEDVSNTCLEHILKTCLEDDTYCGYPYLTNLNGYLTNLCLTNLHLTILRRIQNALTHHFSIWLILELKQHLYFQN